MIVRMYIKVKLLNGFREQLWYKALPESTDQSLKNLIVQVPLKNSQSFSD
jgi:hypothetical protein